MPFQSTISRVALAAVVLLSLGFLVHAAPVAVPEASKELVSLEARGTHCYGGSCYGGLDLISLLLQLQAQIEVKLRLLDGCLHGGDYAAIILEIEALLYVALGAIKGYNIGLIGLLTGKLLVIAKIWVAILISVGTHCSQWSSHPDFAIFLGLIVKLDLVLKLILVAIIDLGGLLGGILGLVIGLITKVHVALLLKIKFGLCLGLLGLGGY